MNARNQLIAVVTALMLVCSSGAAVAALGSPASVDEHNESAPVDADNETAPVDADKETPPVDDDNKTAPVDADNETDRDGRTTAMVTFEDQTTDGQTVVVDEVTMASGGFVVIHDSSLLVGNVIGSVIGTSEYLGPGTHENVTITLDEPLEESETLIAMPHRDTNNNQQFDFVELEGQQDGPYLTPEDEPVTDEAVVTLEGDAEPAVDDEEPVDKESVNETPDEEPVDEEPVDETPTVSPEDLDEIPEDRPVFVFVNNVTVEELVVENVSAVVLVADEETLEEIRDELPEMEEPPAVEDNVTDDLEDEEDNVTDDLEDEEDNVTDDLEDEEDNVTDDLEDEEDNVTEDNVTEDNVTEDNVTEDNVTDGDEAFTVENLDAPESAAAGDTIDVSATISNPSDESATEDIEFRLEGDLIASESVTLDGDESTTVTFEVDTTNIDPGEYIHMILGDEAGEVATIEITEEDDDEDDEDDDEDESLTVGLR